MMQTVDAETAAILEAELELGEALEWAGRPEASTLATQQVPQIAFAVIWMLGVGYSFRHAPNSGNPVMTVAFAFLMLAVGLFVLWQVLGSLVAAWRTFYGITNRRVLVLELGVRRRITSWTPHQITSVQRRDRGKGRGDVTFHQSQQPSADGPSLVSATLVDVAEVRAVEACIRRLAAS